MLSEGEIEILNSNDWNKCIAIIEQHWNTDYGTYEMWNVSDGTKELELTTGGWSENEKLIDEIANTMFWFFWWQESIRGGYYKFICANKIEYEED